MEDSAGYIKLASIEDFEDKRIRSFSILAKPVAVVKDPDGTFWATEIGCKHNNFDLTNGDFKGDEVRCPRHGWTYNIRSGACLNHLSAPLRRHALEVRGTEIFISMYPIQAEVELDEDDWDIEIKIKPRSVSE
jgi:nitrite reductase/ring-hydroxylating ferredoxin subunit